MSNHNEAVLNANNSPTGIRIKLFFNATESKKTNADQGSNLVQGSHKYNSDSCDINNNDDVINLSKSRVGPRRSGIAVGTCSFVPSYLPRGTIRSYDDISNDGSDTELNQIPSKKLVNGNGDNQEVFIELTTSKSGNST